MKLAIIGAGISGLTAAYRLQFAHDVTVFEAADYAGGHTHTVDVEVDGRRHPIDTGFMVFNDWTYPHFCALLGELGIGSRPTCMSFSVQDERTGLEYNGHSLNTLFAQRRNLVNPRFYRLLADIVRFNGESRRLAADCDDATTVGQFLARGGYAPQFAEHYLLPLGAAIWSCPTGVFADFPIRFVIDFYANHGLLNLWHRPTWRVIAGGARTYVTALMQDFGARLRLQTPIAGVRRLAGEVEVTPRGRRPEWFDHVIFACHSDQALQILGGDATATERELLGAFPYQRSTAVLHTDVSLLPRYRRAWACWNFRVGQNSEAPATVTYNLSQLQGIRAPRTFLLTLNDAARIGVRHVLGAFEYHHPVFTTRGRTAQARHVELIDRNRTSFCGAYWRNGFHEDGVVSALAVVERLRGSANDDERRAPEQRTEPGLAGRNRP